MYICKIVDTATNQCTEWANYGFFELFNVTDSEAKLYCGVIALLLSTAYVCRLVLKAY